MTFLLPYIYLWHNCNKLDTNRNFILHLHKSVTSVINVQLSINATFNSNLSIPVITVERLTQMGQLHFFWLHLIPNKSYQGSISNYVYFKHWSKKIELAQAIPMEWGPCSDFLLGLWIWSNSVGNIKTTMSVQKSR